MVFCIWGLLARAWIQFNDLCWFLILLLFQQGELFASLLGRRPWVFLEGRCFIEGGLGFGRVCVWCYTGLHSVPWWLKLASLNSLFHFSEFRVEQLKLSRPQLASFLSILLRAIVVHENILHLILTARVVLGILHLLLQLMINIYILSFLLEARISLREYFGSL